MDDLTHVQGRHAILRVVVMTTLTTEATLTTLGHGIQWHCQSIQVSWENGDSRRGSTKTRNGTERTEQLFRRRDEDRTYFCL